MEFRKNRYTGWSFDIKEVWMVVSPTKIIEFQADEIDVTC